MSDSNGDSRRKFLIGAAVTAPALMGGAALAAGALQKESPKANGKVAIVTGSSRGIGAATAKRLALDGFAVTVNCEKNRELAATVVEEIKADGGRATWIQADVSDAGAVRRLFEATERAFGGVDVVVSNAGIMRLAPFAQMSDDDYTRMVDVNQKGSFFVLREAARRVRHGGRIIALSSSITALRTPTYGPYAASKGAQDLFVSVLAKELAGRQISVNAVAPGVVDTTLFTTGKSPQQIAGFVERTPHKRLGTPADVANTIATLCAADAAWVNGQTVFANGGIV